MPYESELLMAKLEENLNRFFRGRGDYHQALDHLTQLGKLRGPVRDSGAEEGMYELARSGRAELISNFVTKTGGAFWYRIASEALEQCGDADAVRALKRLARNGRDNERQYAINALRRMGKESSHELVWFSMLAIVAGVLIIAWWRVYGQDCTVDGVLGLNKCPVIVEPRVVVANTGGQDGYLRRTPSLADRLTPCAEGVQLKIVGPDAEKDGVRWRQVEDPAGQRGWMPTTNLVDVATTAVPAASSAAPASGPSPGCLQVPAWANEGKWFTNHRTTQMWSGPREQTDAFSFSDTSDRLCVFQERDRKGSRLYVFNPYTENYFWIDEFTVNEIPTPETRPLQSKPAGRNCSNAIFVDGASPTNGAGTAAQRPG